MPSYLTDSYFWEWCMLWWSKMSLKSKIMKDYFFILLYAPIWELYLVETQSKLNVRSQRYSCFSVTQNNKIQRKLNTIICYIYILKSILASSDSFCLITSHLCDKSQQKVPYVYFEHFEIFTAIACERVFNKLSNDTNCLKIELLLLKVSGKYGGFFLLFAFINILQANLLNISK